MAKQVDVAIVGGGMVGMGCALALAQIGFKVALLESQLASHFDGISAGNGFDDRTLVVNPASLSFWKKLGVWQSLDAQSLSIEKVHVSNQGQFGVVNFSAKQLGVAQLGAVIGAQDLVKVLWQAIQEEPNVNIFTSSVLQDFKVDEAGVNLTVLQNEKSFDIQAELMVAADGARSGIRKKLALQSVIKPYDRTAIICNAQFTKNHDNCAYERLTQNGPLALLPFHHGRCGLVWSVENNQADDLLAMNDSDFIEVLQNELSYRMGSLKKVGRRSSYPVYQVKVPNQIAPSVVLMGNAAHSVSPVSAQGLNLAVRGIKRLVTALNQGAINGLPLNDFSLLELYQAQSKDDQNATLNYTDDLMTWFEIDSPWVKGLRSVGLLAIDVVPSFKKYLFERAGGLKA